MQLHSSGKVTHLESAQVCWVYQRLIRTFDIAHWHRTRQMKVLTSVTLKWPWPLNFWPLMTSDFHDLEAYTANRESKVMLLQGQLTISVTLTFRYDCFMPWIKHQIRLFSFIHIFNEIYAVIYWVNIKWWWYVSLGKWHILHGVYNGMNYKCPFFRMHTPRYWNWISQTKVLLFLTVMWPWPWP